MADTKISSLSAVTNVLATDEFVLARSGTTKKIDAVDLAAGITSGGGLFDAYALYQDQKSANTAGGSSTSGSWQTRVLNTEVFDTGTVGSLASNQVTLPAGTYLLEAWQCFGAQGNFGPRLKGRIRDVTNSATLAVSTQQIPGSASGVVDDAAWISMRGRVTLSGSTAIEVQYQTSSSIATIGLGWAANFGEIEIYTELMVWRES